MFSNGLDGVVWAGGLKSATGREKRADGTLIEPDQGLEADTDSFPNSCQNLFKHTLNCSGSRVALRSLAKITISKPASLSWFKRKFSRIWRRSRLRSTARFTRFLASTNPNRGWPKPFNRAMSLISRRNIQTGSSKTCLKSTLVNSLSWRLYV